VQNVHKNKSLWEASSKKSLKHQNTPSRGVTTVSLMVRCFGSCHKHRSDAFM